MKLPKLAIENHQFTLVMVLLLVLMGAVSYKIMPRSEDPPIYPPGVSIVVVYPGANPVNMEKLIVDPIEEEVNTLEDIKKFESRVVDGLAVMTVEFEGYTDADENYDEVNQKVNSIRDDLPEDIVELEIHQWSTSDVNILQIALISEEAEYRQLEKEADRLKKLLERVAGVREVETWAFPEQEVRVSVDLEKTANLGISLNQVMGAIQSSNANIPAGSLDLGNRNFNIQTSGDYQTIDDIRNTIVHTGDGKIVFLRDVADVNMAYEDETYTARVNNERAVFVSLTQKDDTNIFTVTDVLKNKVEEFKEKLPGNIRVEYVFDQSVSVAGRVDGFFLNLIQGVILVGLVVILALGLRAAMIVILVIPTSIIIAIGLVDLTGYGLQQMTIVGLVIAIGLLVDNAIVVTENTSRFLRKGMNHKEAAVIGTSQIAWPVISSTVTTVLAFAPMIAMQTITGDFIRSMPVTVVYTLGASLLLSLTFTPYLCTRFLRPNNRKQPIFQRFLDWSSNKLYSRTLGFSLRHPVIIIILALAVFAGSIYIFPLIGVSFFPKAEKPQFVIDIKTPDGSSLDYTNQIALDVDRILTGRKDVAKFATNIGHGNPQIYYNLESFNESKNRAQVFVQLKEYTPQSFQKTLNELRDEFAGYPGAEIEVKEFEQGPPVEAPIAVKILGDNLEVMRTVARDVEDIFSSTEGTIYIDNPLRISKTDLHVNINRAKANMLGIPLVEIDRTVRAGITGLTVSEYRDEEGDEYDIVVRLPFDEKQTMEAFDRIMLTSYAGAPVPLKQVASLEFEETPSEINHYNLERSVTIKSDVVTGYSVNRVTKNIISELENYNWPKGFDYYIGGEIEQQEESFGGLGQALLVALVAILGVLVLQFRSFAQPLVVFSAIPLAIVGSIVALLVTGYSFSFTAFVGLTSLVGIVINNSIILVDYANQLRRDGKSVIDALMEAGETRFIPIILTTLTTIGGLLPLALFSGEMFAPMCWAIIGGLLTSTVLTLVVVPVLYKIISR